MSRPLLERRDCGAPLWASFLFSSGVHMAAISLILFFPSWSHKSYYTAPKAFMVSLVELPGLPKGFVNAAGAFVHGEERRKVGAHELVVFF